MHEARLNHCYLSSNSGSLLCSLELFSWLTSGPGTLHDIFKSCTTILEMLRASLVSPEPCHHDLNSSKARYIVTKIDNLTQCK